MRMLKLPEIGIKLVRLHDKIFAPLAKKYEINQSTMGVIIFIADHPSMNTARDICREHMLKSAIASVAIENAIQSGYLRREPDKNDRRIQRLYITEKALPLIDESRRRHEEFEAMILSDMTDDESKTYIELSEKLLKRINSLDPKKKKKC